jgi:hypothetical protein
MLGRRGVELLAALTTSCVLLGGVAAGVPFLRERAPEAIIYSLCCVFAVLVRGLIDLLVRTGYVILVLSSQLWARGMMRSGARQGIARDAFG